ncbi:MAG TPA: NAD-binding protein [Stellaceae bacterium]|nr:NAD-binding protein [Stellaceae bacterium]
MPSNPQSAGSRKDRTVTYTGLFRLHDWIYLAPLAVIGIALGVWGLGHCGAKDCNVGGWPAKIIKSIGFIRGSVPYPYDDQHPLSLVVAEFLMPALFLVGGAKLVLANLRRDFRVALARRQSGHTIVCGLGDTGRQIVENLLAERSRVVAVTLDDTDPNAIACERLGVAVLKGDATQVSMLRLAGLLRAHTVVITCGSDSINIEVALRIKSALEGSDPHHPAFNIMPENWRIRFLEWLRATPIEGLGTDATGRSRPLRILPEVRSAWLLELMRTHPTANLSSKAVETRPFDLAANAAKVLLERPEFGRMWRIYANGAAPALQPHLVISGLGEFGVQIIARAVQTTFALPGFRLAVTILDQQGEASAAALEARYPGMRKLIDWQFIQTVFEADNPGAWPQVWTAVEETLHKRAPNLTTVAAIVTLKEDRDSLHTALQMRERLDKLGRAGTPVFVRLRQRHELGQFAASLDGADAVLDRLIPFGDLGELTATDVLINADQDTLAHAVHDTYRAGKPRMEANVPWNQLAERFKQSNRASADHIPVKLAAAGMRLADRRGHAAKLTGAEVEMMSVVEHHRWMMERQSIGWTKAAKGTEPDAVARRSPDLVPWEQLSEDAREKDRDVVRAIPASIAAAGQSILRERIIDGTAPEAEAALAGVSPHEQAVVIVDPHDKSSWVFAEVAARRGAKLWVVWHEGSHKPLVAPAPPIKEVRDALELAVSAREAAAIFKRPLPAAVPRRRRNAAAA